MLPELPMMSAHHYALTIFFDQAKEKTNFWVQFFMCHQLNYPFKDYSLAAFLFVETFIKMDSHGTVDNGRKLSVSTQELEGV